MNQFDKLFDGLGELGGNTTMYFQRHRFEDCVGGSRGGSIFLVFLFADLVYCVLVSFLLLSFDYSDIEAGSVAAVEGALMDDNIWP